MPNTQGEPGCVVCSTNGHCNTLKDLKAGVPARQVFQELRPGHGKTYQSEVYVYPVQEELCPHQVYHC
jgi:hypothetical protein